MNGKFKCYTHHFSTNTRLGWDIHMSEHIHLTTGEVYGKSIMYFGRIPKGLTVVDMLK